MNKTIWFCHDDNVR